MREKGIWFDGWRAATTPAGACGSPGQLPDDLDLVPAPVPGTLAEALAAASPTSRAAEVKIPVYLAAGAKDRRAVPQQTEAMAAALKAAGNAPEGVIIQDGEMHGFYKEENRVALYTKMLDFFRKYIGDGTGPAR